MYDIAKSVILPGGFELNDMIRRLNRQYMKGALTEEQLTELEALAREKADPALSVNVIAQLEDHETRLRTLENGGADPVPAPSDDWPAWQVHRVYRTGDHVTFEGKRYICNLPEHTVETTWSPAVYPGYWTLVES